MISEKSVLTDKQINIGTCCIYKIYLNIWSQVNQKKAMKTQHPLTSPQNTIKSFFYINENNENCKNIQTFFNKK